MSEYSQQLDGACLILGEKGGAFEQAFHAAVAPELRRQAGLAAGADIEPLLSWVPPAALASLRTAGEQGASPAPAASLTTERLLRQLAIAPLAVFDHDLHLREIDYLLGAREALATGYTLVATRTQTSAWAVGGCSPKFIDLYAANAVIEVRKALKGLTDQRQRQFTSAFRKADIVRVAPQAVVASFATNRKGERTEPQLFSIPAPGSAADAPHFLPTRIGIRCGDIRNVNDVAFWVNSENDRMQMARVTDRSISATIRDLGANPQGLKGDGSDDAIAISLARAMGVRSKVDIGQVLITETPKGAALGGKNGVIAVAHVAAVRPAEPGKGFVSGGDISACVRNALDEVETYAVRRDIKLKKHAAERERELEREQRKLRRGKNSGTVAGDRLAPVSAGAPRAVRATTILFPLLGAGDGGVGPELVASQMVGCIVDYVLERSERAGQPARYFDTIYLLAFEERHKAAIRNALAAHRCIPETPPGEIDP